MDSTDATPTGEPTGEPTGDAPPRRRDMTRHLPYGGMPLLARIGVTFSRAKDGIAEGVWKPEHEALNPNGGVHGGLFSTVFDAAMSMAINSALPPEDYCVSLELKASTMVGGRGGETFDLTARVLRLGSAVIFAEASATRAGEVVATANGTFLRRRKANRPPG